MNRPTRPIRPIRHSILLSHVVLRVFDAPAEEADGGVRNRSGGGDRGRLLLNLNLGLGERHLVHLLDDSGGHVLHEGLDALGLDHLHCGDDLLLGRSATSNDETLLYPGEQGLEPLESGADGRIDNAVKVVDRRLWCVVRCGVVSCENAVMTRKLRLRTMRTDIPSGNRTREHSMSACSSRRTSSVE